MTPPREGASTEADSTTARTIVNTATPAPTSLAAQPERCESPPRKTLLFRACQMRSGVLPISHSRNVRAAQQVSVCR